ncbi:MAG: hypothetical protein COX81_03300 [Candidatus Magasanikbacteria bacterium CG_4_10_14_0_2_um_filter_37_12]|uniref:3D domain-containing protein n=1 Tax=Candidatus Magasanikbacteria bacterium CG_4_10_14_0_2_um_filter_37_12 TaxID=1974637 RepID=A0A2M7V7F6_9BACT|nr:MAG: hypothetical protein COX81_03300 [Candidatus Magasanikbacteria bacterium CG_4_10_14_0_2_um_filter_37_12]
MIYLFNKKKFRSKFVIVFLTLALLVFSVPRAEPAEAKFFDFFSSPVVQDASYPKSGDKEPAYDKWVVATAYSSDPRQTDSTPCGPAMSKFDLCENFELYGLEDTIASNFLSLGTKVKFPGLYGDKIFTVRDRMNVRYNGTNRIDFWVGSVEPTTHEIITEAKQKAVAFGVKSLKMEVYSK